MANVQKYKQAAVGHMLQHYDRRTGDNVKRANQDIDPAKTHLNYDLHSGQTADSARTNDQQEWLKKRLSEVKHRDFTKFDDNLFCDWVITLPADVPKGREADFFKAVYDFCCDRYDKKNVISAWVHMDEITPHMHFAFVPVKIDKDGKERLCAKEVISRFELQKFHPKLQEYVENRLGQSVSILNGATAGGNLSIIELKTRAALNEMAKVKAATHSIEADAHLNENMMSLLNIVTEELQRLNKALQAKKWFRDNDKAKLDALSKELETLRQVAVRAGEIVDEVKETQNGLAQNVDSAINGALADVDRIRGITLDNLKTAESYLIDHRKKVTEKENNLDQIIAQKVEKEVLKRIKAIEDDERAKARNEAQKIYAEAEKRNKELIADNEGKEARGKELDKEIAEKEKNSKALGENCAQLQQDVEQLSADKESLCQSIEKMQQGKNANFKDFMAAMKWLYSADIQSVNAYIRNSQRERER